MVSRRRSIYLEGVGHQNPIPNACRIGPVMESGSILGTDAATGRLGETLPQQCAAMFANIRALMQAAGGSPDDIVKMTVWMNDRSQRAALNQEWLAMFPDHDDRPARHTMQASLDGGKLIECTITAVLS